MPWDTNDYPSSFKNLNTAVRKKAIDIANAMIDEGYEEDRAIPIATEQAKEWYEDASDQEVNAMKQASDKELRQHEKDEYESRPELLEKGEHVVSHEDGWAVKAEDAKQPSDVFDKKEDAVDRAEEIAKNKQTQVVIHKKDGSIQQKKTYSDS